MIFNKKISKKSGFTLAELLVGVAVFTVLIIGVYNAYKAVFDVVSVSRYKISAIDLANEKLEIARNLPYASVGVSGSIPSGVLAHTESISRDGQTFDITTTVRNIDDPFDGTLGGTPNDTSPADSKLIEIQIDCDNCKSFKPIIVTSRVSPKNLETASTNGALLIRVFDANGSPVPEADVHIENNKVSPAIVIDDVTNNSGNLLIVDVPPGNNAYEVTVSKSGYSTDSTASTTASNPNPTKPQLTVLLQQVTTQSFIIDRLSTINFSSITDTCSPVASIPFSMVGSKTIGTSPVIYKYNQNKTTDVGGTLSLNNIEWDTYNVSLNSVSYELIGTNSLSPIQIAPNSTTNVNLIVAPKNPNTVLVVVKDAATLLPLSDATVELISGGSTLSTRITGKGFLGQTDWSSGSGQATSTNLAKYFQSDGNISINNPVGDLKLRSVFGVYEEDGNLESSSFDTGGTSNFKEIIWTPTSQIASTGPLAVRFRLATNDDGGVWDFKGPDGTQSTYYDLSNRNIHSSNNAKRYLRYKLFLHTDDTGYTPNISDIAFTFTNSCTPPGQVFFSGLSNQSYILRVSKSGYESQDVTLNANTPWQLKEVILLPE
jgi:prepilin-type N-terminal cleavage/methylation domain-containing protein